MATNTPTPGISGITGGSAGTTSGTVAGSTVAIPGAASPVAGVTSGTSGATSPAEGITGGLTGGTGPAGDAAGRSDDGRLLTGLFNDRESAENAYRSVSARGYGKGDVNIVMSDEARARHFGDDAAGSTTELGTKAAEGAGIGGAIGGGLGAVLAAVAAVGTSLVLPGLGLVVAGPLAAGLAGAGAGAATGGIIGALIGWGIPEERVAHYEEGLKKGGILMAVRPKSDEDAAYFENDWRANRGEHVYR